MHEYHLRLAESAYPLPLRCLPDEDVMQALVTAGAMVAVADGSVEQVERDELVNFIDHQVIVPSISPERITTVFETTVRELDDRNGPNIIVDKFRPLAGLSLGSIVIRVAQRVAAADGKLHQREVQAIDLIRLMLAEDSVAKRRGECLFQPMAASRSMRQLETIAVDSSSAATGSTEYLQPVLQFLQSALPMAAVGLGLLASAAWTALLGYWAFRTARWTISRSLELLL